MESKLKQGMNEFAPVSRVEKVDTLGYFYSISEQKYILTTQLEWKQRPLCFPKFRLIPADPLIKAMGGRGFIYTVVVQDAGTS